MPGPCAVRQSTTVSLLWVSRVGGTSVVQQPDDNARMLPSSPVKWLMLCEDLGRPACGGILFAGTIPAPTHCPALDGPPSSTLPPNKLSSE